MPAAPYTDMAAYLTVIRGLPKTRLDDDEAAYMLERGKQEEVYLTLLKIPPYVAQRYIGDIHYRENYQDVIQAGNMAIWQCIQAWQPNKGMTLASWAHMYCKTAMLREMRKDIAYLEQHVHWRFDTDPDTDAVLEDWPESDSGSWEEAQESAARYRALRSTVSRREQRLLDMLLSGETQEHIADNLELSQSRVSRLIGGLYSRLRQQEA